jgi:hypothetical protein
MQQLCWGVRMGGMRRDKKEEGLLLLLLLGVSLLMKVIERQQQQELVRGQAPGMVVQLLMTLGGKEEQIVITYTTGSNSRD